MTNELEGAIHTQIAKYLNMVIKRSSRWHTVEVSNQAKGKAAMIRQMALKRKGVVTGWPDIEIFWDQREFNTEMEHCHIKLLPVSFKIIFLEVKAPKGVLTERQKALHEELREDGHHVFVVRSVDETKAVLTEVGMI